MNVFKATKKDASGCLQGTLTASYADLVKVFGKPNSKGDGYKVSTEWVLEDQFGHVIHLYDWKETKKYDRSGMTIKTFRALPSYDWHVGGQSNYTTELTEYFESKLKAMSAQKKLNFVVKPKVAAVPKVKPVIPVVEITTEKIVKIVQELNNYGRKIEWCKYGLPMDSQSQAEMQKLVKKILC